MNETTQNQHLQRLLELPVRLQLLGDLLLGRLWNLSERKTALSTKTLLDKVVKEVFLA
jgi:hypothetical protein